VDISNLLGQALGMPLIKSGNHHGNGEIIGTPKIFAPVHSKMQTESLNLLVSKHLMMVTTMDTTPTAIITTMKATTTLEKGRSLITFITPS
jgi:hypothetical protein